uniref:G_PROTEIN_RECEP_F1_2 domain-containing protein n=1 Tax=Heligmosomoides polygyrus TaxID=6339 RepID=A0A183F9I0_HELPZ
LALICSALIVTFWLFSIWVVYWPTPSLDEELEDLILANTGLHAPELAFLGVSLKTFTALTFTLFISILLLMSALGTVISWAAYKIHTTLKKAIYSGKLKELHRQMFVLLLLQSACPFCFLHAPCFLVYILFFGGVTSTPFLTSVCSILMASFPLFSPIIIIGFLKDYRRHALVLLRIYRPASEVPSISVFPSRRGQTTSDLPQ